MLIHNVAIVGAGPAGYFAAQAIQRFSSDGQQFRIDLYERLPTPWGLLRSGVAPDHIRIKEISKVFEDIASHDSVRLLANVDVGKDISLMELERLYDAVVIAVGTPQSRLLDIQGENLKNVFTSEAFVSWYNGHPEYQAIDVNLDGGVAVIVGAGNVALDIARLLTIKPKELESTDIAEYALEKLQNSQVEKTIIMARRGPECAAFSVPELRQLLKIESISVAVEGKDILNARSRAEESFDKQLQSKLELLSSVANIPKKEHSRTLQLNFEHKVISLNGVDSVSSVTVATPDGIREIECGLVVTAIGYSPENCLGIPYNDDHYTNINGHIRDNLYVVGWAKRGAKGIVGTNRNDANSVVKNLVNSLSKPKNYSDPLHLLQHRGVTVIDKSGWNLINNYEVFRGADLGKPRLKLTEKSEMLRIAGQSKQVY